MTDLTDRIRTCAAHLTRRLGDPSFVAEDVVIDAADLLLEASNALEAIPEPLGEPMEIIEPVVARPPPETSDGMIGGPYPPVPRAVWTTNAGDLPAVPTGQPSPRPNRVCPKCDSRAHKRVFRHENKVMLACPACAAAWEYAP